MVEGFRVQGLGFVAGAPIACSPLNQHWGQQRAQHIGLGGGAAPLTCAAQPNAAAKRTALVAGELLGISLLRKESSQHAACGKLPPHICYQLITAARLLGIHAAHTGCNCTANMHPAD